MVKKKTPNLDFMMTYVERYLKGRLKRWEFDLDFDHHIMDRYAKMEREDAEYAEAYAYYISTYGVDCGNGLSDSAYKKLIQKQYEALLDVAATGFI
jgi:hypothetical protein